MDLVLRNASELAEMLQGNSCLRRLHRLAWIDSKRVRGIQHCPRTCKNLKRLMCPFWQIEFFLGAKQAFDKAVEFLPSRQGNLCDSFSGCRDLNPRQPKWRRALLMASEPIP